MAGEYIWDVGGSQGRLGAKGSFEDQDTWSRRQRLTGSPGRSGGRVRYNLRNHSIEAMDCHESCCAHSGDGLTSGGKHTIKGYFIGLSILFTLNSYLCGSPKHHTDVELTAASSKYIEFILCSYFVCTLLPSLRFHLSSTPLLHSIVLQPQNCNK